MLIAASALAAGTVASITVAGAKGPGSTYCFYKTCHRVKTIAETQALVGRDLRIMASHYDSCAKDRFNPCGLTSSGERFAPERADNAASPILPDGTIALVWSKTTQHAVVLRINNAGPYWGNRKLDLSRAAARKLGIGGVGEVMLRVLKAPTPAEARYAKNRRYDPVPGPIGQFASIDDAHAATTVMVAQGDPAAVALAGLEGPAGQAKAAEAAIDIASAYGSPVVPGFAIPKGALADALIAQTAIEQHVVTAVVPPVSDPMTSKPVMTNVSAVAPNLATVKPVTPKRTRVKAVELKPGEPNVLEAVAGLMASIIDPPKPERASQSAVKRPRSVAKPAAKRPPAAKAEVATVVRAAPRVVRVAKAEEAGEYRAGFTTYQEDRYRKTVKPAPSSSSKAIAAKAKPVAGASNGDTSPKPGPTKQAGISKPKKQAALKKGGWQSSAVMPSEPERPVLAGQHPRVPVDGVKDERPIDRERLRRVHPSALA